MPTIRNEQKRRALAARPQVRAAAADIRRYAAVAAIKRRALDPTPIVDDPRELSVPGRTLFPKKPRALFVIPAKYAKLLQACRCLRAR
jgi:hypothetical protein